MLATRILRRGIAASTRLTAHVRRRLVSMRVARSQAAAATLQASVRRRIATRGFTTAIASAVTLQAAARRLAAVRAVTAARRRRRAAMCMQSLHRGAMARLYLQANRAAATHIAACVRGRAALISYAFALIATNDLQRAARGQASRRHCRARRLAIVQLQAAARAVACRRALWRALAERRVVAVQRAARRMLAGDVLPHRRRVLHACAVMKRHHALIARAMSACAALDVLRAHERCRIFAVELGLLPYLLRSISSCNRSPHSMALLRAALPLAYALLADAGCRVRIASYAELVDAMLQVLVGHFGGNDCFNLAADCLFAAMRDVRARDELANIRCEELLYKKRSLVTRLGGTDEKPGKRRGSGQPVDPRRAKRLVSLLK